MSFSAASLFLMLMVVGELTLLPKDGSLSPLDNHEDVQSSLRRSCLALTETGPLAEVKLSQLIEFQRQSLERFKRRRAEFVSQQCEQQKSQQLQTKLRNELIYNKPGFRWIGKSPLESLGITVTEGRQPLVPPLLPPQASLSYSPLEFHCNRTQAEADFAQQFGHGASNPLEEQLKIFADLNLEDFIQFWDAFCGARVAPSSLPQFIDYEKLKTEYNQLLLETESTDLSPLFELRRWSRAEILDDSGSVIGPLMDSGRAVTYTPLDQIPTVVQQAFIAAEDKNFYSHRGIEVQGVLRGFLKYMRDGSIEGGSTITQQLVKNVLLNNDISLERKVREMLLARKVEAHFSKDQILEAYLNIVYLGRGAYGVSSAAARYFGEQASLENLTLNHASFLAGITHSPNRYNPSLVSVDNIQSRQSYVLDRMVEANMITGVDKAVTLALPLDFAPLQFPPLSYYQAAVSREFRTQESQSPFWGQVKVQSAQNHPLQESLDSALQKHLSEFEMRTGKVYWQGPLRNISYLWDKKTSVSSPAEDKSLWMDELLKTQSLFSGVKWSVGVILQNSAAINIGVLEDGVAQVRPLSFGDVGGDWFSQIRSQLKVGDVIFAQRKADRYFLRVQPTLQAAVVVMDVITGEVKALTGGFDHSLTSYNRALYSRRQPGSTVKPFVYFSALDLGIPTTRQVSNSSVYFPGMPGCRAWSPQNYSLESGGSYSLEDALVHSMNRVTARLLYEMSSQPEQSLQYVYKTMQDFGLYGPLNEKQNLCYPVVLGSQELTVLDLAKAYAVIANGGWKIQPTFLKRNGFQTNPQALTQYDRTTFTKLSAMLSKVITSGTGYALREHQGKVAGKTGTSSNYRDAWFAGYSNHHVVVAWMGYDRDRIEVRGRPVSLSLGGNTGGRLVAPLVNSVFQFLFQPLGENSLALDPGTPLTLDPKSYIFDQVWKEWVAPLRAWQSRDFVNQPMSQLRDAPALTEEEPAYQPSSIDPKITVETLSPEVEGILQEDSWQRLRTRRDDLMESNN